MSPFWGSFFEHLRGRGRDATPFFLTFVGLIFALIGVAITGNLGLFQYANQALASLLILALVWCGVGLIKARNRQYEPFKRRLLSSDEARVARSKLLKSRKMNGPQQQY